MSSAPRKGNTASSLPTRTSTQKLSLAEKLASTEALYKSGSKQQACSFALWMGCLGLQGPNELFSDMTHFCDGLRVEDLQDQPAAAFQESVKPRREQRPLPPPPPEMAAGQLPTDPTAQDAFNQRMYEYWDRVSLVGCQICGRTFKPEAFEKHAKVCTPDNPGGPLGLKKGAPAATTATARPGTSSGGPVASKSGSGMTTKAGSGGGGNYNARPLAYVCYLCGAQYGSNSLAIHIPQCQKKWQMRESDKPRREQRAVPRPPPEMDQPLPTDAEGIQEFNNRMFEHYNNISLVRCPGCQRTFNSEAYERHSKSCGGGTGAASGVPKLDAKPRGYTCFLCGQQFGSASLTIHIPQCHEMWLKKEAAKLPYERRPPPPMPSELDDPLPNDGDEIDAFNNRMFEVYNGASLVRCTICSRTFTPEALERHRKACTPDSPFKGGIKASTSEKGPLAQAAAASSSAAAASLAGRQKSLTSAPGTPASQGKAAPARAVGVPPAANKRSSQQDDGEAQGMNRPRPSAGADGGTTTGAAKAPPLPMEEPPEMDLVQCDTCGRSFNPASLQRHQAVCAKVFVAKRKTFNMAAKRVDGTDAAQYQRRGGKAAPKAAAAAATRPSAAAQSGKPAWKNQSEALRQAMQAQRQVAQAVARGEDLRNIPYVPSGPDPSFVQCPTCKRHFSEKAAERHIPKCSSIIAKPKALKGGSGGAGAGRSTVVAGASSSKAGRW